MSKRIFLTDKEIQHIINALRKAMNTGLIYQLVTQAGKQVLQDIIDKISNDEPKPKERVE